MEFQSITTDELSQWLEQGRDSVVPDPFPQEHFAKRHIPGAINACVFEVVFPDEVVKALPDGA
ncbi:MAG: hypothetical protein PVG60_01645 [Desulfarculaceae bacterium]